MGDGPNGQSRIVDRLAVWSVTQVRAITRAAAKFRPPALRDHWAVFEHAVLGRPFVFDLWPSGSSGGYYAARNRLATLPARLAGSHHRQKSPTTILWRCI